MENKIQLADTQLCCGCAACFNVCPKNAITMKPAISGFLYPEIDEEKCIRCGLCQKSCPALDKIRRTDEIQPKAFLVQHIDEKIRRESTSGGAFTALAEAIIAKGGVVFGAAMQKDFVVRHCSVETVEELEIFRNSKYVQSEIGRTFAQVKEYLLANRWVLFSGTPCQIHGLLKYLHIQYEKLITVDLVCHSVPSPAVFSKYMELQLERYSGIDRVVFRDKARGYDYSTMAFYQTGTDGTSKCVYRKGSESDLWFRSFLPGLCDRENCYDCGYQEYPRCSDITIWDCFVVKELCSEFDDNKGTTSVVAWSDKAKNMINDCKNMRVHQVAVEVFLSKINREKDKKLNVDRKKMYEDLQAMNAEDFFDKYRKNTLRVKLKGIVRTVLYYTGLQSVVKQLRGRIGK